MFALLRTFTDICLFQAKPQELPVSTSLVWLAGIAAIITSIRSLAQLATALAIAATQVLLMGLILRSALVIRGYLGRWPQAVSAMYGSTALINLVALPVVGWMERAKESPEAIWPLSLGLAITLWFIAVMAHVLRCALELTLGISILLSGAFLSVLFLASFALLLVLAT